MKLTTEQRLRLEEKLDNRWALPKDLFGDCGIDMNDFDIQDYVFFLDNVGSLEKLLEGLRHLSPLADDALGVAEKMKPKDFYRFKKSLKSMRENEEGTMPKRYRILVIPLRFAESLQLAETYQTPLGVALLRSIDFKDELNVSFMERGYY